MHIETTVASITRFVSDDGGCFIAMDAIAAIAHDGSVFRKPRRRVEDEVLRCSIGSSVED
jgi:hypothetical protein